MLYIELKLMCTDILYSKLILKKRWLVGWFYGVNATFNNISVISSRSLLLVGETGAPKVTTDLPQVTGKLYHIMLYTSP